jgi:hypothetical protein
MGVLQYKEDKKSKWSFLASELLFGLPVRCIFSNSIRKLALKMVIAVNLCILHTVHQKVLKGKPGHPSDRSPTTPQRLPCTPDFLPRGCCSRQVLLLPKDFLSSSFKGFISTLFPPTIILFVIAASILAAQTSSPSKPSCSKSRKSPNTAPFAQSQQAH